MGDGPTNKRPHNGNGIVLRLSTMQRAEAASLREMLKPRNQAWPQVSNPLAREVLEAAWVAAGRVPLERGFENSYYDESPELCMYRVALRQRLAASGIAQRVPGGLEAFPVRALAPVDRLRSLFRGSPPRTYPALVRHLLRDVDTILGEGRQARPQTRFYLPVLALALSAALFIGGFAGIYLEKGLPLWVWQANLLCFCALAWRVEKLDLGPISNAAVFSRRRVQAEELYYYLLESYRDNEEYGAPGGLLPTAELIAEQRQARGQRATARLD